MRAHSDELALVLLDLSMPEFDGYEAFYMIREINPTVPVVLMSGWDPETPLLESITAEVAPRFLHKPFQPKALLAEVHRALEPQTVDEIQTSRI